MELNLSPQEADATIFDGEGGAYYSWTAVKSPVLATTALGAGKLVLQPRGFALPHFSDSQKIGYVTQGECTVGLVSPNSPQEKVVIIKEGDAIPVPMGTISWWFNAGDSDVTIVFLGETSRSYNPGLFDYFLLTGGLGVLAGFSAEFVAKIYNLPKPDAEKLATSQANPLLVKLSKDISMPHQPNCNVEDYVVNLASKVNHDITGETFALLDRVGLSAGLVRAERRAVAEGHPSYAADASHRIIYVTKGSGDVQIVGLNGGRALDAAVQGGQLFVVPKFFTAAQIAGEKGLEFYWVSTSPRAASGQLGGSKSVWMALSAPILQASLNVSPEFVRLFKSKIEEGSNSCH